MQFLHVCHIAPWDLKALNVLLDAKYRIRIYFGFSRYTHDDLCLTSNLWTLPGMLPESTSKVDASAYGIFLYELTTGDMPYRVMDAVTITRKVQNGDLRRLMRTNLNPAMCDLITQYWIDIQMSARHLMKSSTALRREIFYNSTNHKGFLPSVHETATSGSLGNSLALSKRS
jgi:hypothetical protein